MSEARSVGTAEEDHTVEQRLNALQQELARLRELVIRAYDDTPHATAELLRTRRRADYGDAFAPTPLITVRIGAYEAGEILFERAIASVHRQSYSNWEAIVICDGPDETTAERITRLGDSRIRCEQRPRNGPYPVEPKARQRVAGSHPFNEGFALARGAWIAPLDQDDEWSEDHLEALLAAAQSSRAEVVYAVAKVVVGSHGETYFGTWPPSPGDFGFQTAIHHAGLSTFLYDANSYLLEEPADWQLARRMLEAGVRFEFLDRVVTTYFVDDAKPSIGWWRELLQQRGAYTD